jgi:hypothetical protein
MSMWREITAEVRALDASRAALRRFALVVGGVLLAIALFIAWRRGWDLSGLPLILGVPAVVLLALAPLAPPALRPVFRVWMGAAFVMGFVMTRVILTLVFVLLVIPIGLALRLVGKDLLALRPAPGAPTYWRRRDEDAPLAERLPRLY